jgi:hypothetical protein
MIITVTASLPCGLIVLPATAHRWLPLKLRSDLRVPSVTFIEDFSDAVMTHRNRT